MNPENPENQGDNEELTETELDAVAGGFSPSANGTLGEAVI